MSLRAEKISPVEQTVDAHGNVTQVKKYDFGSPTPTRTYNNTYVTSTSYTSREKWNVLLTSQLVANGQTCPAGNMVDSLDRQHG